MSCIFFPFCSGERIRTKSLCILNEFWAGRRYIVHEAPNWATWANDCVVSSRKKSLIILHVLFSSFSQRDFRSEASQRETKGHVARPSPRAFSSSKDEYWSFLGAAITWYGYGAASAIALIYRAVDLANWALRALFTRRFPPDEQNVV